MKHFCNICKAECAPGYLFHNLCKARQKLGLPTPAVVIAAHVEAKIHQGQLFERVNGQWVKVIG